MYSSVEWFFCWDHQETLVFHFRICKFSIWNKIFTQNALVLVFLLYVTSYKRIKVVFLAKYISYTNLFGDYFKCQPSPPKAGVSNSRPAWCVCAVRVTVNFCVFLLRHCVTNFLLEVSVNQCFGLSKFRSPKFNSIQNMSSVIGFYSQKLTDLTRETTYQKSYQK